MLVILWITSLYINVQVQGADWDIWPMFTPILGIDQNSSCYKASARYIQLLNESLSIEL